MNRFYEQGAGFERLRLYVMRWTSWLWGKLTSSRRPEECRWSWRGNPPFCPLPASLAGIGRNLSHQGKVQRGLSAKETYANLFLLAGLQHKSRPRYEKRFAHPYFRRFRSSRLRRSNTSSSNYRTGSRTWPCCALDNPLCSSG